MKSCSLAFRWVPGFHFKEYKTFWIYMEGIDWWSCGKVCKHLNLHVMLAFVITHFHPSGCLVQASRRLFTSSCFKQQHTTENRPTLYLTSWRLWTQNYMQYALPNMVKSLRRIKQLFFVSKMIFTNLLFGMNWNINFFPKWSRYWWERFTDQS